MLKSLTLAFNFLIILILSSFLGNVSVIENIPDNVKAGDMFTVSVTIDKRNIGAFGRYQLQLPNGFEAKSKDSNGGVFSFVNSEIRIMWYQLPYDDRFTFTFEITVPPTVSGEFPIKSSFSYIKDNNRTIDEQPVHNLIVEATESVEDLTAVNTYNYKGVRMKEIDCIRQKPYMNDNNEIIVNLLVVNKVGINEYGKIQEQIPRGYKAVSLRGKNSIFTNNGRVLKFMWMNLPENEHFVVTYKLIKTEDIPNQIFLIKGEFTYTRYDRNQVVNIAERNVNLEEFAEDDLVVDNTPIPEEKQKINLLEAKDEFTGATYPVNPLYKKIDKDVADKAGVENIENKVIINRDNTNSYIDNVKYKETNYALSGVGEVTYKVQVAAGHKLVKDSYFRKLKLRDPVQIEIHQGWHKYTVGSHQIYIEARNHRNRIWKETPIKDAFVCAYNSGQRVTVQEALMIANQKWYK